MRRFRQQKIVDTQHDFQGYSNGLDQTAGNVQNPEQLEKQLADAQNQLAQLQANGTPSADTPEALKQGIVNREGAMEAAQSAVERAQRELDDAKNGLTGIQQARARFEQQEKDALAQIDKTYSGVTNATEVFQWYVRDDEVVSASSGVELTKQNGTTVRQDRGCSRRCRICSTTGAMITFIAVLNVPENIAPGQQPSAS